MSEHTPGPWMKSLRTVYALNENGVNRFSALVQDAHAPTYELEANARLIAAAPELLEALKNLLDISLKYKTEESDMAVEDARAAIAKATGETK